MRAIVFDHLRERNIPCLMVTHDRDDAPIAGRVFGINTQGEVHRA